MSLYCIVCQRPDTSSFTAGFTTPLQSESPCSCLLSFLQVARDVAPLAQTELIECFDSVRYAMNELVYDEVRVE